MSLVADQEKAKQPHDEVDFSSGFETQYLQEYRPKKVLRPAPPDPSMAWYRDCQSVTMIIFLFAVLVCGSTLLIRSIFSTDPTTVVVLLVGYMVMGLFFIWLEVFSKYVR
ncbi:uncharacterized protein [Eurosta solidaginis]|uniref:uncharacterized protein n=1 Tax=Eurosta solidaginis TaxID=178769 RepID=UPI003530D79B